MADVTVTDKDREYAVAAAKECNGLNDVVEAIATARAEEREQCLMLCQRIAQRYESAAAAVGAFQTPREMAAQECAAAIRARGED